jgi:23S rRNA G2445 N2-methylase RlmL
MIYKHFENRNFEDFSSGRVIYNNKNYPNYPVRLAAEIFSRCLEHTPKKNDICLYDPCCGSAYLTIILGYLFNKIIGKIYCSDISEEAIELSQKNLSLLSFNGISRRKNELNELVEKYKKESHKNALCSLEIIKKQIKKEIPFNIFKANILEKPDFIGNKFVADIIITDVPYGNLVNWSTNVGEEINVLLDGIIPIINNNTIIAISYNKNQNINNKKYCIIEKIKIGHRRISIMKLL